MMVRSLAFAAAIWAGFSATATAAECVGSKAVPGTLAATAAKPCPAPARRQPAAEQARPKDPPGTFRSGNTTVKLGGGIISEAVVRGR